MALYSDGMGLAWLKVQTEKRNEVICFMGFCVKTLLDGRNPRVILCKLDAATISFFCWSDSLWQMCDATGARQEAL